MRIENNAKLFSLYETGASPLLARSATFAVHVPARQCPAGSVLCPHFAVNQSEDGRDRETVSGEGNSRHGEGNRTGGRHSRVIWQPASGTLDSTPLSPALSTSRQLGLFKRGRVGAHREGLVTSGVVSAHCSGVSHLGAG